MASPTVKLNTGAEIPIIGLGEVISYLPTF